MFSHQMLQFKEHTGLFVCLGFCFLSQGEKRAWQQSGMFKVVKNFQIIQGIMVLNLYNISPRPDTNRFCLDQGLQSGGP